MSDDLKCICGCQEGDMDFGEFETRTPEEKVEYFREKATRMQRLAYQFEKENQQLRGEIDNSWRDDEMEPTPTLNERLDHIERRLTDLEDWRRFHSGL